MSAFVAQHPNATAIVCLMLLAVAYAALVSGLKNGKQWPMLMRRICMLGS